MRAALVYNPIAGRRRGEAVAGVAEARLRAAGWTVTCVASEAAGDAANLAQQQCDELDLVVAIGGDGTLREVVAGLLRTGPRPAVLPAVGFVPMGNSNVVARELGIPLDPDAAIEVLLTGRRRHCDVGAVEGHTFLAMVGVGYDAAVTGWVDRARDAPMLRHWYRWHGDSLYAVCGLLLALRLVLPRVSLTVDGVPRAHDYAAACIANMASYAKGWAMVPDADPACGRLHWHGRRRGGPPFVVWSSLAAMRHRRVPNWVGDYGDGAEVIVRGRVPFAWQADGDSMGTATSLTVTLRPGAVEILVPPEA